MMRKKFEVCMLCCPGSKGWKKHADVDDLEQVKAIGRYWLGRYREGFRPGSPWGWFAVCADDAEMVKRQGYSVEALPGFEEHEFFAPEVVVEIPRDGPYKHNWDKTELVTQDDGWNNWRCLKCDARYKQHNLHMSDRPDMGCHVVG
jgi:hypothetical protein